MTRYRLLDAVDWEALHNQKVQVEVSDNYIILTPLKPGGSLTVIAKAVLPRHKENGQLNDVQTQDTVEPMAHQSFE